MTSRGITAEALARAFHENAVEWNALGSQHPPVVIPPWEDLAPGERERRVTDCQRAIDRLDRLNRPDRINGAEKPLDSLS